MGTSSKKEMISNPFRAVLSEQLCEEIFNLAIKGVPSKDIAKYTNTALTTVYRVKNTYDAISIEDWAEAMRQVGGKKNSPYITWASKKLGISIPENVLEEELPSVPVETEKTLLQSSDDIARVLVALGSIDEKLECIGKWLTKLVEDSNSNSDIIAKEVRDMRGAVIQHIKKIPKTYRGEP